MKKEDKKKISEPNLIINRVKELSNVLFNVDLDAEDEELYSKMILENWDDPDELGKAMSEQPVFYARWAYMKKRLNRDLDRRKSILDVFISDKKEELRTTIYNENIEAGSTPNNAKPSATEIDNRFKIQYISKDGKDYDEYMYFLKPINSLNITIDKVEIIDKVETRIS